MIERRTVLESSFAESVWSMGGINVTHLAITPKYLSTTPEIVPGCQTLGEAIILCWQQMGLYCCTLEEWIWKVWLILTRHLTKTQPEQFPSLTVLICTKITWYWSFLLCQVLRWDRVLCVPSPKLTTTQCTALHGIGHEDAANVLGQVTGAVLKPHNINS